MVQKFDHIHFMLQNLLYFTLGKFHPFTGHEGPQGE